jgi:transcriptional regulator with XRE-family HTH domain
MIKPRPIVEPWQLKEARKALGFHVADLAAALRLAGSPDNARTAIREMESGKRPISGPIAVAVEGMLYADALEGELGINERKNAELARVAGAERPVDMRFAAVAKPRKFDPGR